MRAGTATRQLSMAGRLLCFCVLLTFFCVSWARNQTCLTSASTCNQCIQSGPDCGWCIDPHKQTRCNTLKRLQRAGCPENLIYNPKGELLILRNEPADGSRIVLEPQEVSLVLRPGLREVFTLTITTSSDQPIKELTMDTNGVTDVVNITFKSISTVNPVVFEVNIEAVKCPGDSDDPNQTQNKTGPWSVHLKPRGFSQSLKLQLTLACECECLKKPEPDSSECNDHGTMVCGQCLCQSSYSGQQCQKNLDSMDSQSDDYCRTGPRAPVCSGRGICEDGFCICNQRKNPEERYSGRFCECSNFDCPHHNGRICGGKGKCECGQCVCDVSWAGEECSCSLDTDTCLALNGMICNGTGMCLCGACKCSAPYSGPTCELCPTCQNQCQEHMGCAECQAFKTDSIKDRCEMECQTYSVRLVDTKDDVPGPLCKMMSQENHCFFYFSFSHTSPGVFLTLAKAKECPRA